MTAGEAITAALAGMAIVIAALSLWITYRRDRARVEVEIDSGVTISEHISADEARMVLRIAGRNAGRYREVVDQARLATKGGEWMDVTEGPWVIRAEPTPCVLEPGNSWFVDIDTEELRQVFGRDILADYTHVHIACASGRVFSKKLSTWDRSVLLDAYETHDV